MTEAKTTTDHDEVRKWAEARGAKPAGVRGTGKGDDDAGILRFDFDSNGKEDKLEEVSWDEFFKTFEDRKLALLYQDKTKDGKTSRFFKFVQR